MTSRAVTFWITIAAAYFTSTSAVLADELAFDFDNTGFNNGTTSSDRTIGWAFSLNEAVVVTGVGFWDITPGDNLTFSHDLAIWSATGGGTAGDALVSGLVDVDDAFEGGSQFRFADVSPTVLSVGDYVIGAFLPADSQDYIRSDANNEVFASQVTFDQSAFTMDSTFQRPDLDGLSGGRYGPNFRFRPVPEPTSIGILLGLVGAVAALSRQR